MRKSEMGCGGGEKVRGKIYRVRKNGEGIGIEVLEVDWIGMDCGELG